MRRAFSLVAALTVSACVSPESHRVLEPVDGSTARAPWTICQDAVSMGSHMDSCSDWEGQECGANATTRRADVATCIGGRVLKVEIESTGGDDASVCTDPLVDGSDRVQIVTAAGGCADLFVCDGESAARRTVCQRDPLPGVRADAAGLAPWTDCAAALQDGMDGDPCEGALRCLGRRALSPSIDSNTLLVYCDGGILRMSPMQSALHSLD